MTLIEPEVQTPTGVVEEGDHEKLAHVVVPASAVTEAYVTGSAVTALCGKVWTPTRDASRFAVCPSCIEVFERETGQPWTGRR